MTLRQLVEEFAERLKKTPRAQGTASSQTKQPGIVQKLQATAPRVVQSLGQFMQKYPSPAQYVGAKVAPQVPQARQFIQKYPSPASYVQQRIAPQVPQLRSQPSYPALLQSYYRGVVKPSLPAMKGYVADFVKSVPEAGKAIVRTTAPYQAYREMTGRPMSGWEKLSEGAKVITPLYLGLPTTPAKEMTFAAVQAARQGKKPMEVAKTALKGVETRPGFGAMFTDDPKWQTAINLAFMGAMIAKPYLQQRLDRVVGSKTYLDEMSKTLDIPKNASLEQAQSNWLGKTKQLLDKWSKEPQTPKLAFELDTQYAKLNRAAEIFKGYGVIDRNFATVLDYIGQQGGFVNFGSKVGGKPKPPAKPSEKAPPLLGMIGEGKVSPKFKIKLAQEKIAETQADLARKFVQKPTERGVLGEVPSIGAGRQATQLSIGSQMPTPMDEFLKQRPPVAVIKPTPPPVQPKVVARIEKAQTISPELIKEIQKDWVKPKPQPSKVGEIKWDIKKIKATDNNNVPVTNIQINTTPVKATLDEALAFAKKEGLKSSEIDRFLQLNASGEVYDNFQQYGKSGKEFVIDIDKLKNVYSKFLKQKGIAQQPISEVKPAEIQPEEKPFPEEIEAAQASILEKAGKEVRKEKITAANYKGWDIRQFLNRMRPSKEGNWVLPNTKKGVNISWDEVAEDLGYDVDGPTTEPKPGQIVNKAFYDDLVELKGGRPGAPAKRVAKVKSPQFQKTAEFFEVDRRGVIKRAEALPEKAKVPEPFAGVSKLLERETPPSPPVPPGGVPPEPATEGPPPVGKLKVGGGKYNISDLDFSEDIDKFFRRTASVIEKEVKAERRGTISTEETQAAAMNLGMTVDQLKGKRKGRALNDAEIVAAANLVKGFWENELIPVRMKYKKAIETGEASDLLKVEYLEKANEGAVLMTKLLGARTELGRALNANKIIKEALADPSTARLKKVYQMFKGEEGVDKIMKKFAQLDAENPEAAYKFLSNIHRPKFFDYINWYWLNSIVSGPRTHLRNNIYNTWAILTHPSRTARTALGETIVAPLEKRPREVLFKEVGQELTGFSQGFTEGARKFLEIMRKGYSMEDVGTLDVKYAEPIRGKPAALIGWPLRLLKATDAWTKVILYEMTLNGRAFREAVKEVGNDPNKVATKMSEILANPSSDLMKQAIDVATKETLWSKLSNKEIFGAMGIAGAKLKNFEIGDTGAKPFQFIIPFISTPVNAAKMGFEEAGFTGTLSGVVEAITSKGVKKSEAVGRAFTALTIGMAILFEALRGNITADGPENARDRDLLRETGWQPRSIKIGDKYYSYKYLSPLDHIFYQPAKMAELMKNKFFTPTEDIIKEYITSITALAVDQTFLSGLVGTMNWILDPSRYSGQLVRTASGFIPNFMATLAQTRDRVLRDPETLAEYFKTRIPYLSNQVKSAENAFGEPIVFEGGALGSLSPSTMSTIKRDKKDIETLLSDSATSQQITMANRDLRNGKLPKNVTDVVQKYTTAEFIVSKVNELKTAEEKERQLQKFDEIGYLTPEIKEGIKMVNRMKEADLTKADREMFLYESGLMRAQKIITRMNQIEKTAKRNQYLQRLIDVELLDEETKEHVVFLNELRKGKMIDLKDEVKGAIYSILEEGPTPSATYRRVTPTPQPTVRIAPSARQEATMQTGAIPAEERYIIDDVLEGL